MAAFGDYQNEIYFRGLSGVKPKLPVDFASLEKRAQAALSDTVLTMSPAAAATSIRRTSTPAAFSAWGLIPRMMVDCSKRDLSVELFGIRLVVAASSSRRSACSASARRTATAISPRRGRRRHRRADGGLDALQRSDGGGRRKTSATDSASSSSTRRPIANWPRALCVAPRLPASRRSSSRSTPG